MDNSMRPDSKIIENTHIVSGDASSSWVKANRTSYPHMLSERASWLTHIEDFGTDGTRPNDANALAEANRVITNNTGTSIARIANNTIMRGCPSDLIGNDSLILRGNGKLIGFGRYQAHADHLPSPSMFPPNIRPEHLTRFHQACAKGSATVVFWGDSINSVGGDLISTSDYPVYWVMDAIQKANPKTKFTFINLCIPGLQWSDMGNEKQMPPAWVENPEKLSWMHKVASYKPDLVINHSAGNDGWHFNARAFKEINDFFEDVNLSKIGHIPSIIYGITYQPSIGPIMNNNSYEDLNVQQGIDYCATYIRNWCIANNRGFLDYGRWHAMCRDGIDPRVISMERVQPKANTTLPDWDMPVATDENAMWEFPDTETNNGVNARHCTSFLICFTVNKNPGVIQIALSNSQNGPNVPMGNDCFIIMSGKTIIIEWTDGNNKFSVDSEIAIPEGALSWTISLKDSRLLIELQIPPQNGWNYSTRNAHTMGMGYVVVFDRQIARFGAAYTPHLNFAQPVTLKFHNLTVANATAIEQSGHRSSCNRYAPIISSKELYEQMQEEFGGSGSYHGNIYLYRIIMAAIAYTQPWQIPNTGFLKSETIEISGKNNQHSKSSPIYIGEKDLSRKGTYFVGEENGGLSIVLNKSDGAAFVIQTTSSEDCPSGQILGKFDADNRNFLIAGNLGANGITPPDDIIEISGQKPVDPILKQILHALSMLGLLKDQTI